MGRRYLNFLIIPDGTSREMKFRLSLWKVRIISGILGLWIVLLIVLTIIYGKALSDLVSGKSLRRENERLKEYNAKVVELEKELLEYRKFTQKVALLAGIEYPSNTSMSNQTTETVLALSEEEAHSTLKDREVTAEPPENLQPADTQEVQSEPDSLRQIPTGQPIDGWITRGFSLEGHVFGGEHTGIDFAAREGTEVKVTADGRVSFVGWDDIYGNLAVVDHGNGFATYYGHNSRILVNSGDFVNRGEVIALSGNSGRSSAPHLHYEIRKDQVPIDPKDFLSPK